MIADAFDLPPMLLGLERDVNRNTATTQYDDAFRTAVVPVARLVAEHLTRDAISKRLGWDDLEFVFTDVDAPNEMEQAQIQQILIGCGVLTVNEVRGCAGWRHCCRRCGRARHRGDAPHQAADRFTFSLCTVLDTQSANCKRQALSIFDEAPYELFTGSHGGGHARCRRTSESAAVSRCADAGGRGFATLA